MKRMGLALLLFGAVFAAKAQGDVVSAYNANKDGKYEEAIMYIEKAGTDPKATAKEKYWRYRGNIYQNAAADAALASKYPNAVQLAKESYFKSMELDKNGDYKDDVRQSLGALQGFVLGKASDAYSAKDFCTSGDNFVIAKEISDKFSIIDSSSIFNAAFCYQQCKRNELAIAGYQRCAEIGYNVPEVYMYIADIHQAEGKNDEALKVLGEARSKFPKDPNVLRAEVNIYLTQEQYDKAESILKSLTEADPKNEMIWFVLGVTYEKLGKKQDQENAYKQSLGVNPNYYDALFNLGAMYFNDGLEKEKQCNEIPPRETAKYNDCQAAALVMFKNAATNLETAYNQKPEEKEIMAALKDAYYKAGNIEGYNKMKALMAK